jgi:hypothetical protein
VAVVKWCTFVLVAALACAWALPFRIALANQDADLIIDPPSGGAGSRFQIVGQWGWTAGETVQLRVGFAGGDPAGFSGPFAIEEDVTVLADATWSFPVVLNDGFFGGAAPVEPGTVVIQAESPSNDASATFAYTGIGPPPAEVGSAGFGPAAAGAPVVVIAALFAAGVGVMAFVSGGMRRYERR